MCASRKPATLNRKKRSNPKVGFKGLGLFAVDVLRFWGFAVFGFGVVRPEEKNNFLNLGPERPGANKKTKNNQNERGRRFERKKRIYQKAGGGSLFSGCILFLINYNDVFFDFFVCCVSFCL